MDTMNQLLCEYLKTPAGLAAMTRVIGEEYQRIVNESRPLGGGEMPHTL